MKKLEAFADTLRRFPLLLPPPKKARPTMLRLPVHVPEGFVLPKGNVVTQPFDLTVEAGVRWHPEWAEPRITVNAWRFFPHGDSIGWSGDSVAEYFRALLPYAVRVLSHHHGQHLDEAGLKAVAALSLDVPTKPEPRASFIAKPVRRGLAN